MLGVLLLVAAWFWAPLVYGWVAGKKPNASPPAVTTTSPAAATSTATPTTAAATTQPAVTPPADWRTVSQWIDNDPRMHTATATPARDPLVPVVSNEVKEEEKPEVAEIVDVKPDVAGLVLSSTLVGTKRSVAQISGKTYRTGEQVSGGKEDQKLIFTLSRIGPRFVVQ